MIGNKSTVRKVGEHMSFVGMHIMRDGIIAFADSKATLSFKSGRKVEDIQRGPIQKIFKNNQFILVTHGNNEIFSEKNKMNIEDYINNKMIDNVSYEDFLHDFYQDITNCQTDYNDGLYQFIIGSKNENGKYFLLRCTVQQGEYIKFSSKNFGKSVLYGGEQSFCKMYEIQQFYYDIDIHKYASMLKTFLEKIVEAKDPFSEIEYNPVGLPINIEIFQ